MRQVSGRRTVSADGLEKKEVRAIPFPFSDSFFGFSIISDIPIPP